MARRNVKRYADKAKAEDAQARERLIAEQQQARDAQSSNVADSFVNFAMNLGIGSDNPMSGSTYGFNPITRNRTLLEWIHRGSWLGGVAVDVVADDMTREGVEIKGEMEPDDISRIEEVATALGVWEKIGDTIKWSRLYGGAIAVMLIDGQDPASPLRLETVRKGQFAGLQVLDRWMVEPSLGDLVTDFGPDLGLPKFYRVTAAAPALNGQRIHHSRCIRLTGIKLPYMQALMENLWGISVLERLYDRMVSFDSATTGSAQLVYKSYLRTLKVKNLREVVAMGGKAMQGLVSYVDTMRRFQGIEGMSVIDAEDEFQIDGHSAFSGLSEILQQFALQLSGALQIPLVRLFGQSPAGFSDGDNDLRNYYDKIKQDQERDLKIGITKVYRAIAASEDIEVPEGFSVSFRPLWQLSADEKATIANNVVNAVSAVEGSGLIDKATALKELRQSSNDTGIFSNITDEDIDNAKSEGPPLPETATEGITPSVGQANEAHGQSGNLAGPEADQAVPQIKEGAPAANEESPKNVIQKLLARFKDRGRR